MASSVPGAQQRIEYLEKASDILFAASPHSAAFLKIAGWNVANEAGIPQREASVDCCAQCGNRLVPGWSSRNISKDVMHGHNLKRKSVPTKNKNLSLECSWCGAVMTLTSVYPASGKRSNSRLTSTTRSLQAESSQAGNLSSPNSSSSKIEKTSVVNKGSTTSSGSRKRTRNSKSTLRSMLTKSECGNTSSKGHGLEISDLMA